MGIQNLLQPLLGSVVACFTVNWVYFKILKIALEKNLVDNPNARKLQKRPVPVMGGIAVFFGVLIGFMLSFVLSELLNQVVMMSLMPVLCAMAVMLYVGALDDIIGLTPISRLIIEILVVISMIYSSGMCIDTFRGLWGIGNITWWIAVPLTVFAGVGIVNAINMVDGVNGLSTGLCIICCIFFGISFYQAGDIGNSVLAFIMIGGLLPFFIHNVFGNKSRMFIGDAGTMVMGILITWFLINILSSDNPLKYYSESSHINLIAMSLAILSVPIFDTLRVMTMRMMKKKSPFQPDKTHLHHVFVNIGISHFITSVSEILIDMVIVAIFFLSVKYKVSIDCQLYIVIIASSCFVWGTYGFLQFNAKYQTKFLNKLTKFSVKTHLGRTDIWKRISAWLDAPGKYINYDEDFEV